MNLELKKYARCSGISTSPGNWETMNIIRKNMKLYGKTGVEIVDGEASLIDLYSVESGTLQQCMRMSKKQWDYLFFLFNVSADVEKALTN